MSVTLSVYTVGGGDYLESVFNAVAAIFGDQSTIGGITKLAVILGGMSATFMFTRSRDLTVLLKWMGLYVMVTSLMLYPKATVAIEDFTGRDIKPRIINHVPLSLAVFASLTSRIGQGFTEIIETVFHMPDDVSYQKTGMLMGSKLVLAASNFQITDPEFSQTLNEFMQQCVFYDILLNKYTVQDLTHADNPWTFIKERTSVARAFPMDGQIVVCKDGAAQLDKKWHQEIQNAATIYGAQIFENKKLANTQLLSRLKEGYSYLTNISQDGESLLKTNLLTNAISQAINHYGANVNAPAALQAYQDTKTELQNRMTLDATGRQSGIWLQQFKNIVEALLYSAFIIIYFLSFFPFGAKIIQNYLTGMFYIQSLSPLYAIIHYASSFYAQNRSMAFLASDSTHSTLSMENIIGITQANADAMALAGYLMWPVTIGGAIMIFRGMPSAIQGMGQYLGGVAQHTASSVAAETVGGNISMGNTSFGNHSMYNTNANHFDANGRYASGMMMLQTGSGSSVSISPSGSEVMDNRGAMSNLGVDVRVGESIRAAASQQMQASYTAGLNKTQASGEQYTNALRNLIDFSEHRSHGKSSDLSFAHTETSGLSKSAQDVAQLVRTFEKTHGVSHQRALELMGQVYAGTPNAGGTIPVGISGNVTGRMSSQANSAYNDAKRFAEDHHFNETVDIARRESKDSHFRTSSDDGQRYVQSISSSFDRGDSYRREAASSFSEAKSYSSLASMSQETAASINANYTQEFYQWMQKQPSIYGTGHMSRSMIDDMIVNDPTQARAYADQFVHEKTDAEMQQFKHANHIDHGKSQIAHAAQQYSHDHSIHNKSYVDSQHHATDRAVSSKNQIPSVDESLKANFENNSNSNKQLLEQKKAKVSEGQSVQSNVKNKLKGGVVGSLGIPKDSLASVIFHNEEQS